MKSNQSPNTARDHYNTSQIVVEEIDDDQNKSLDDIDLNSEHEDFRVVNNNE
jgi:hypothetical protein